MTTFTVNGEQYDSIGGLLTYEHVVTLAGLTGNPIVVFRQRDGEWTRNGTLGPTEVMCDLRPGTRFTVCHTGNA